MFTICRKNIFDTLPEGKQTFTGFGFTLESCSDSSVMPLRFNLNAVAYTA